MRCACQEESSLSLRLLSPHRRGSLTGVTGPLRHFLKQEPSHGGGSNFFYRQEWASSMPVVGSALPLMDTNSDNIGFPRDFAWLRWQCRNPPASAHRVFGSTARTQERLCAQAPRRPRPPVKTQRRVQDGNRTLSRPAQSQQGRSAVGETYTRRKSSLVM